MSSRPVVYFIDGSSQMYRAFHAPIRTAEGSFLRNAAGQPTNAVYIFVTMLRKLLREHHPQYIAASFDLPGRTFRDDLATDYKANRSPMPDELAGQIPLVHRACEALGVPIITHERYEADDVIGTLATRAASAGYGVAIVTGDKDFFQLVGDGVRVFNPRDEGTWFDAEGVREKFGVGPEQVVDTLALMGDSIDNIKGVPGVGEKGARELISTYGTLDALIERAPEVRQKRYREALMAHQADARASRELLTIRTDVPVELDIEALEYRGPSREACFELFSELGFRSLVTEYAPTAETTTTDYALVTSSTALRTLASELRQRGRFGCAVVTDEASGGQPTLVGLAFSTSARAGRYVPLGHSQASAETGPPDASSQMAAPGLFEDAKAGAHRLQMQTVIEVLEPLLEDPAVEKVGHDLKAVLVTLAGRGVEPVGLGLDTMLASYLLDATRSGHPLETTALEHLGYRAMTREDVLGRGARARQFGDLAPGSVLVYACERADLPLQLADVLWPKLRAEGLDAVYRELEQPLLPILAEMERFGVRIDCSALAVQSQRMDTELAALNASIYESAGEVFNINSPQQLSKILFEKLQLPMLKRSAKTRSASTGVEVLEELALTHELPRLILEWRALQKLKSTYVDALPQLVNPETGRVHTTFNQAVAATGRLSSSDPNLQNIPIRTEVGREIRAAFVADPGHLLISADYSQIELRVLAHLAGDDTLIRAFRDGADIHDQTALKVFGANSGLDPHELRRRAKIINYALLYGKTAFTLSRDIGVTPQIAQAFIDAYFAGFPKVKAFITRTIDEARTSGVVKTMYGRRRLVPDLNSRNGQARAAAERTAVNLPIQGTAADIMKRAMIDVHAAVRSAPGARMILTVHDELLFEVPEASATEVASNVRLAMEGAAQLCVPLTVDVGVARNWRDAKG